MIVQVYYCTIKFKSGIELSSITKHELGPAMRAFCRKPLLKKRLHRWEYLLPFVAAVDDGNNTDGSNWQNNTPYRIQPCRPHHDQSCATQLEKPSRTIIRPALPQHAQTWALCAEKPSTSGLHTPRSTRAPTRCTHICLSVCVCVWG